MARRNVAWVMVRTGDGDAYYIDWRAFENKYGSLNVKQQGNVLREISKCHEEKALTDGPIVMVRLPEVFTEATDGR